MTFVVLQHVTTRSYDLLNEQYKANKIHQIERNEEPFFKKAIFIKRQEGHTQLQSCQSRNRLCPNK